MSNDAFLSHTHTCDLVMKGGITSGVVFPRAITTLARTYRFKNIGGTSAGAIAAAAAAAAEFGRGRAAAGSFAQLDTLPTFLGSAAPGTDRSRLFSLFQPQPATAPLFRTALAGLGSSPGRLRRIVVAALTSFPGWAIVGALPGVATVAATALADGAAGWKIFGTVVGLGLLALGVLAMVAFGAYRVARDQLPANLFGLCTGMAGSVAGGAPALTEWLTSYLDELAGLDKMGSPAVLTFADLWGRRDEQGERAINLEMMTTCLTHGRPYRLPFRDDDDVKESRRFYFRRDEFESLFPKRVVEWMVAHPRAADTKRTAKQDAQWLEKGYYPLPTAADLPVIVAVRMSLSFPILLSAIPLHAIDYTRKAPDDRVPERCLFSDGGICSNFPVHFFDAPLPRRPTFAINLTEKHPDHPAGVYLPKTNREGLNERWNRFAAKPGLEATSGLVFAILNTAKDWPDTLQSRLPGYRDRVAHVSLNDEEGGLNLNMPASLIEKLSERGAEAAAQFVERFALQTPPEGVELTWDNHRWVRLRATIASLEEMIGKLDRGWRTTESGDVPYADWVSGKLPPPSYPFDAAQRAVAEQSIALLDKIAQQLAEFEGASGKTLSVGAPRPPPELRVRPRV